MAARRNRPAPAPVPAEAAVFILVGIPADPDRSHRQIQRALRLLERGGFRCSVSSDDAIAAAAQFNRSEANGGPLL